jgi:CheY-like chemotaxis protein
MPAHIVIVHDDTDFLDMIEVALGGAGDQVRAYCSVIDALVGLDEPPPVDLLITRIHFPDAGKNGIALALMARQQNPKIKILFVAAPEFKDETANLGKFLTAPVSIPDLLDAIDQLLVA